MDLITLEKIRPEEICFDSDGVVYPFVKQFVNYINSQTGSNHSIENIRDYDLSFLGFSDHDLGEWIVKFHKGPGSELKPYKSAVELFDLFYNSGINIQIITSRTPRVKDETIDSFLRDFEGKVSSDDIYFTEDSKGIRKPKSYFMKKNGKSLIIEDCYKNAKEVADAGYSAIIVNHDYNINGSENVPHKDDARIFRMKEKSLLGLINMIPSIKFIDPSY